MNEASPVIMSAGTLAGDKVCNRKDETLGRIQDIMLDTSNGRICYAVLASGGVLGMGNRLFAIPWSAMELDTVNQRFILDVDVDRLRAAPGFDKDHWPNMADRSWATGVDSFYGSPAEGPQP